LERNLISTVQDQSGLVQ